MQVQRFSDCHKLPKEQRPILIKIMTASMKINSTLEALASSFARSMCSAHMQTCLHRVEPLIIGATAPITMRKCRKIFVINYYFKLILRGLTESSHKRFTNRSTLYPPAAVGTALPACPLLHCSSSALAGLQTQIDSNQKQYWKRQTHPFNNLCFATCKASNPDPSSTCLQQP